MNDKVQPRPTSLSSKISTKWPTLSTTFKLPVRSKRSSAERTKAASRPRLAWTGLKKAVSNAATSIDKWGHASKTKLDEKRARSSARKAGASIVNALKKGKPIELDTLRKWQAHSKRGGASFGGDAGVALTAISGPFQKLTDKEKTKLLKMEVLDLKKLVTDGGEKPDRANNPAIATLLQSLQTTLREATPVPLRNLLFRPAEAALEMAEQFAGALKRVVRGETDDLALNGFEGLLKLSTAFDDKEPDFLAELTLGRALNKHFSDQELADIVAGDRMSKLLEGSADAKRMAEIFSWASSLKRTQPTDGTDPDAAAFDQAKRIVNIRQRTGGTLKVGTDGRVSGTVKDQKIWLDQQAVAELVTFTPLEFVEHAANKTIGNPAKWVTVGGKQISASSNADLKRMHIVIKNRDGTEFDSKENDIEVSVSKIGKFAGSDEVAKVIFSVAHQNHVRKMFSFVNPRGESITMGPVPKGGWIPTVIAEDGSVEEFPKEQIGNAVIELSDTPDGDIQVKVNWTQPFAYVNDPAKDREVSKHAFDPKFDGRSNDGPDEQLNCLGARLEGSYVISRAEAEKGKLKIPSGSFSQGYYGEVH